MTIVRIDGWNYVPRGYSLSSDASGAPLWLRAWLQVPFIDRFAYPLTVRRGHFRLSPMPGWQEGDRDAVPPGWNQ